MKLLQLFAFLLLFAACNSHDPSASVESDDIHTDTELGTEQGTSPVDQSELMLDPAAMGGRDFTMRMGRGYRGIDNSIWCALRKDPRARTKGLDAAKNHRLVGEKGEVILIPANSLEQLDGRPVRGPIDVRWAFAEGPMDFVVMRAPTVSDNTLLGSGGSFFLEAMQEGEPLRIKPGRDWVVRMPTEPSPLFPEAAMRIFSGVRGSSGDVEWTLEPQERIEMQPLTFSYYGIAQKDLPGRAWFARIDSLARLYPERNNTVVAPSPELAMGRDKARIARMALALYDDPRYEGTYVCSLPFMERLALLAKGIFAHARTGGTTHWIDERGANDHIIAALEVYAAHADGPLHIADSIVRQRIDRADAIIGTTPGSSGLRIKELREAHVKYAEQHLGLPIVINDRGVDLDSADAFDRLMARGLTMREADALLDEHAARNSSIGGVRPDDDLMADGAEAQRLRNGRLAVVRKRAVNTVRFSTFGYINCDRFLRKDVSTYVDLIVTLGGDELNDEDVQLLIPSVNGCIRLQRDSRLRAYRLPPQFYGLPIGLVAHALVVGERDGRTHFDLQHLNVSRSMSFRLDPKAGTMDELARRVGALGVGA